MAGEAMLYSGTHALTTYKGQRRFATKVSQNLPKYLASCVPKQSQTSARLDLERPTISGRPSRQCGHFFGIHFGPKLAQDGIQMASA